MTSALHTSALTSLPLLARGKVRDNYAVGDDRILMVASDRISAFDVIMGEPIPGKGELLTRMRYHPELIGNTFLPAIHGGTLGAMLEMAAIFHLLWETETETVPKIVNITVDYLRSARPVDVIACAKVTKQGRRMVNVFAEAWQEDRSRPVATANAHFLVKSDADAPPSL